MLRNNQKRDGLKICKHGALDTRADFQPNSVNEEKRTAIFVASSGAKGMRRTWSGDYYEELQISAKAVRLDRYNSGAPFLKDHNAWSIDNQIGVIERAWIENNLLMTEVRFAADEQSDLVFQKVRDGIIRSVSVGYRVHTYKVSKREGELDTYTATDWEPFELSAVTIPFDAAAQVRGDEKTEFSAELIFDNESREADNITDEGISMNLDQRAAACGLTRADGETDEVLLSRIISAEAAKLAAQNGGDAKRAADEAVTAERKRSADIYKSVGAANLGDDFARELVLEGVSAHDAIIRINEKLIENQKAVPSQNSRVIEVGDKARSIAAQRDVSSAILHRYNSGMLEGGKLPDSARQFRGKTLIETCRTLLSMHGIDTDGMSHMEIAGRALSTSDLPNIVADVANKTLRAGYQSGIRTFQGVFRRSTSMDFKNINRMVMSGAPSLERVYEDGEFKMGKVTDGKETYSLATYGKILPFTRQAIVNDDLDALTRIPELFGRAAADLESDIVWAIFTANAALSDGVALFHASHNNTAAAGAINATNVGAGRKAMREQTGLEGRLINIMPSWIIAGASKETELEKFLAPIYAATSDDVVPGTMRSLKPIIEPRLTGNNWYLAADYNQVDTIEYCYLDGEEGVYIETQNGFDVDGVKIKARHDFASKAIDYRGLYRNGT